MTGFDIGRDFHCGDIKACVRLWAAQLIPMELKM